MKKNLSKLERVSLREAWKHEAAEFTPWLAESENLNSLSESLGISELVLVATFSLVLTSLSFLILSSGCLLLTLVVRFMISESTSWGV